MNLAIVRKKESFLGPLSKNEFLEKLKLMLNNRVKNAYIFGSFLDENFNPDSDLDLILVVDTNLDFFNRYKDFTDLYKLKIPLDLLIYTPDEFKNIEDETPKVGFWKSVFNNLFKLI